MIFWQDCQDIQDKAATRCKKFKNINFFKTLRFSIMSNILDIVDILL